MDVYQCPECELRFQFSNELLQHIGLDHPAFSVEPDTPEQTLLPSEHRHRHAAHYEAGFDRNSH